MDQCKIPFSTKPITADDFTIWVLGSWCIFLEMSRKSASFRLIPKTYSNATHNFSGADLSYIFHYFMHIGSGINYSSPVHIHQLWQIYSWVLPVGFEWQHNTGKCCFYAVVLNAISDLQLKVNLVLTEVLKCSRQCNSSSFNVVQGCVAVVYLSCTMLWHGLGSDTSHNQSLPLWVKIAPLHGLVNLIVIEVIKTVEPNCSNTWWQILYKE